MNALEIFSEFRYVHSKKVTISSCMIYFGLCNIFDTWCNVIQYNMVIHTTRQQQMAGGYKEFPGCRPSLTATNRKRYHRWYYKLCCCCCNWHHGYIAFSQIIIIILIILLMWYSYGIINIITLDVIAITKSVSSILSIPLVYVMGPNS